MHKFINEHTETMKKHKTEFNYLKAENANKHNAINESINKKLKQFSLRENENSAHFNLIRNKPR